MTGIAVIGMAGRLPGAENLDQFWTDLIAGRDCITRTSVEQLRGTVADELLDDPRWIGASGRIPRAFDADPAFFGMSPKETLITDPQHRLLLSTVHQALEDACLVPQRTSGPIGIFAGVGRNRHEEVVRAVLAGRGEPVDELALEIGNDKDHGTTKVAYRLGLRGPAMTVQSACSTGLVALHQAGQSLSGYECDAAVVAAATVRVPDQHGYLYLAGGIGSPDGYCRAFSAAAGGTVSSDGVVAIVLKRLEDAIVEGDRIYAVVRGSAVNNDGAKSGYAMVSAAAQERVIRDALLFAELEPDRIGAVEAHGSGTPLGDAVEWAALAAVYGKNPSTVVGSVKSAIGHTREVSGLAGFVRMALSIHHGQIPPTLHVGLPAETIGCDSGLGLARTTHDWQQPDLRRGAVSSFGLGGTNVHVVLEQAPVAPASPVGPERATLVLVSAHTEAAAGRTAEAWRDAVSAGRLSPAEAADVSQFGRRHRRYRRFAVAHDAVELATELDESRIRSAGAPEVCFVFPGVGDHYPGMAAGLTDLLPGFAKRLRDYLDICGDHAGRDLRAVLRPAAGAGSPSGGVDLRRLVGGVRADDGSTDPVASHAALFSLQLALARSLADLGVRPSAVTGHSLGELAAAAYANVLSTSDALRVVVRRAELVSADGEGAMLAVSLSRPEAEQLTGPGVHLATVNSPRSCVLAGTRASIMELAARLEGQGRPGRLLPTQHAFHTPLLAAAGSQLAELLADVTLASPDVAMVANLTGDWAGAEFTEPEYWQRQLTSPVLFSDALRAAATRCGVLLEIGPGQLRTLAAQSRAELGDTAVATVRREYQNDSDAAFLLRALGRLWQAGVEPDWHGLRPDVRPRRVTGPPTSTDDRPLWIGEGAPITARVALTVPTITRLSVAPAVDDPDTRPVADSDGLLVVLTRLWERILGASDLSPTDDFFDLGGDSMMSVGLLAGLQDAVGLAVPAMAVFEESTLGGMARCVAAWRKENRG